MKYFVKSLRNGPALLLLVLLVLVPVRRSSASPAGAGEPRLEPAAEALRLGEAPASLTPGELASYALIFSGAGEQGLRRGQARLEELIGEARAFLSGISDPEQRAEGLLHFLHEQLFTAYAERETRVDVLLETGVFNCVSSAWVYLTVGRALGLDITGVRAPDHAFCQVRTGDRDTDVETTSVLGFNPGEKREFRDEFGKVTGYSYVPPGQYGLRNTLEDRGLLALILYNRAAFLSAERRYAEAVAPAVDAYAVLRDAESYERMTMALANLASRFGMDGRPGQGADLLDRALGRYGGEPFPGAERLVRLRADLRHNQVVARVEAGDLAGAESLLEDPRTAPALPESEWRRLFVYLARRRAQDVSRTSLAEAARHILQAVERVGRDPELMSSYEVYAHNQTAALLRERRLEEADRLLGEALEVMPDSSLLQRDRRLVRAQLGE